MLSNFGRKRLFQRPSAVNAAVRIWHVIEGVVVSVVGPGVGDRIRGAGAGVCDGEEFAADELSAEDFVKVLHAVAAADEVALVLARQGVQQLDIVLLAESLDLIICDTVIVAELVICKNRFSLSIFDSLFDGLGIVAYEPICAEAAHDELRQS